MTNLLRVNRPGLRAWGAVLAELYRRERAKRPAPTLAEIGVFTGKSSSQAHRHLHAMRAAGLIAFEGGLSGRVAPVTLTSTGRIIGAIVDAILTEGEL